MASFSAITAPCFMASAWISPVCASTSPKITFATLTGTSPPARILRMSALSPLISAGLHGIRRRSLIFVISDFISAPGWERPLSLLNRRHEVVAIRLWDPRETDIPDIGPIIMEDAETGEHLYLDTHD